MHSSIEKILLASSRLPEHLKVIFDGAFKQQKSPEQICQEQSISMADYSARHTQLMREIRAIAA
jgi:DNA-directed RNA polymerase specialized sigma subunit